MLKPVAFLIKDATLWFDKWYACDTGGQHWPSRICGSEEDAFHNNALRPKRDLGEMTLKQQ